VSAPTRAQIAAWADEAAGKAGLADIAEAVASALGGKASVELTIASGAAAASTGSPAVFTPIVTLDGEGDASDTLTNLTVDEADDGALAIVSMENAARIITLSHEATGDGQMSFRDSLALVLWKTTQYVLFYCDKAATPETLVEVARFGFVSDDVSAEAATRAILDYENGRSFTNEGATAQVVLTLPTARAGLRFTGFVQDADGLRFVAASGDTIRIGASVSPAAGYVESTTIGDVITLRAINATEWIAESYVETWTVSA